VVAPSPAPRSAGGAGHVADRTRDMATPERPILFSERGGGLSPATCAVFHRLYTSLKMDGCSSHSGRRTFITARRAACRRSGSLRDVQELAGHTSLAMTQRYIEGIPRPSASSWRSSKPVARPSGHAGLPVPVPVARANAQRRWQVYGVSIRAGTVRKNLGHPLPATLSLRLSSVRRWQACDWRHTWATHKPLVSRAAIWVT